MRRRSFWLRAVVLSAGFVGILGGAFAAGRSIVRQPGRPDPIRLERRMPVGVLDSRAGALAAADNYVATGITASVDPSQLRAFADTVIDPAARGSFINASRSVDPRPGAPVGAHVVGIAVAHRLDHYVAGAADVAVWALASQWDGATPPTQYSALVELSLRWNGDAWQIISMLESVPGPVTGLLAGPSEARSTAVWDQTLSGMSEPYYGDS